MDLRPDGLDLAPVLRVHLIHSSKVSHVGDEDIDLDDVLKGGASGLEDGAEVLDALVLEGHG